MSMYSVAATMRAAEAAEHRAQGNDALSACHRTASTRIRDAAGALLAATYAEVAAASARHEEWVARKLREVAAQATVILDGEAAAETGANGGGN